MLIADEPTTALDVSIEAQILDLMRGLQETENMAIMFITHNLSVVAEMAEEMVVMYMGKQVETGSSQDIFYEPLHPYTRGLLAAVPSLDPAVRRVEARVLGDVPSPAAPPPGCRFHTRCPEVMPRCSREAPPLYRLGERGVRCFLHEAAAAVPGEPPPG